MKLTNQQRKVYDYILSHRGCTTRDIQRDTGIECPSARITEMRRNGVPIVSIGKKRYPNAHPFECYAIGQPLTRTITKVEVIDGKAYARRVEVPLIN